MTKRILIIGGYGNFGRFIARILAREDDMQVIIAGRRQKNADAMAAQLSAVNRPEAVTLDINNGLAEALRGIRPDIVIHTSGPYQSQDYRVARACIAHGCHYIDLADAREFVSNIGRLDREATANRVLVCSGASSVPTLTSAIIDHYIVNFGHLDSVKYGISTAQRTNRGLATTSAILSYAGKPFTTLLDGKMRQVYGWMDLNFRPFWDLNNRPLGNCDIPDLALFPSRYPTLKTVEFQAGLELKFLHIILAMMSWLVRIRLVPSLAPLAPYLLSISRVFDFIGTQDSGFYMALQGCAENGDSKKVLFEIIAREGDGLYIPTIPAILMAKKLARGEISRIGATQCMGFIELDEYLMTMKEFNVQWRENITR